MDTLYNPGTKQPLPNTCHCSLGVVPFFETDEGYIEF